MKLLRQRQRRVRMERIRRSQVGLVLPVVRLVVLLTVALVQGRRVVLQVESQQELGVAVLLSLRLLPKHPIFANDHIRSSGDLRKGDELTSTLFLLSYIHLHFPCQNRKYIPMSPSCPLPVCADKLAFRVSWPERIVAVPWLTS